jgi:DNA-binding transcriptional ArsR family regulator
MYGCSGPAIEAVAGKRVKIKMKMDRRECVSPDRTAGELAALRSILVEQSTILRRTSEHYALLAGETRLKIMLLLKTTGELCVCDLATVLEMTPAAVSQHLSRLRNGRLVASRRDGMTIYYRLADSQDPTMIDAITGRE